MIGSFACSIGPESIDISRSLKSLNEIEEELFIEAIKSVSLTHTNAKVNLDPIGNNPKLFAERMYRKLHFERPNLHFESRKGMDDDCAVTGAASIMAKEFRDRVIADLCSELGFNVGSGYPSDPKTIEALKELQGGSLMTRCVGHGQLHQTHGKKTILLPIPLEPRTVLFYSKD